MKRWQVLPSWWMEKYYSDLDGNFAINGVKPGKYSAVVELIFYEPATMEVSSPVAAS